MIRRGFEMVVLIEGVIGEIIETIGTIDDDGMLVRDQIGRCLSSGAEEGVLEHGLRRRGGGGAGEAEPKVLVLVPFRLRQTDPCVHQ